MDIMHKMNWLGWLLYTIIICNKHDYWIPKGHFLTEKEDGDIIVKALKVFKKWYRFTYYPNRYQFI